MSPDQKKIVELAASWIGTPFYPHCAVRQVGADCVSYALAVYQEAGMVPAQVRLPDYRLRDGEALEDSAVLRWLTSAPWFEPADGPEPGRLVTLRVAKVEHHVGIVGARGMFWQAIRRYGVRDWPLEDSTWSRRITGYWKARQCSEARKT